MPIAYQQQRAINPRQAAAFERNGLALLVGGGRADRNVALGNDRRFYHAEPDVGRLAARLGRPGQRRRPCDARHRCRREHKQPG